MEFEGSTWMRAGVPEPLITWELEASFPDLGVVSARHSKDRVVEPGQLRHGVHLLRGRADVSVQQVVVDSVVEEDGILQQSDTGARVRYKNESNSRDTEAWGATRDNPLPATPVPCPEPITADDASCGLPDLFRGISMPKRILFSTQVGLCCICYFAICFSFFDLSYPRDCTCQ